MASTEESLNNDSNDACKRMDGWRETSDQSRDDLDDEAEEDTHATIRAWGMDWRAGTADHASNGRATEEEVEERMRTGLAEE